MTSDINDEMYALSMRRPVWFAIEGDNGSGKDTLADRLEIDGWCFVSKVDAVAEKKESANKLAGTQRFNSFLDYNRQCAKIASECPSGSFVVRYWPSTVAAGFADAICSWAVFTDWVDECLRNLPIPELVVFLQCTLSDRRNRVHRRGHIEGAIDNVSNQRDLRYRKAIAHVSERLGSRRWKTVDTSEMSIEQVHSKVQSLLADLGKTP